MAISENGENIDGDNITGDAIKIVDPLDMIWDPSKEILDPLARIQDPLWEIWDPFPYPGFGFRRRGLTTEDQPTVSPQTNIPIEAVKYTKKDELDE